VEYKAWKGLATKTKNQKKNKKSKKKPVFLKTTFFFKDLLILK
jgi:hypothetical protein